MKTNRVFICLLAVATFTLPVHSQNYVYATGNPSFSTQIPIENGFINLNNGEMHMEVPIATHAQRGSIPLLESLEYDSRIWQIIPSNGYTWQPSNVPNSMGGWRLETNNTVQAPTYNSEYSQYGSCGPGQEQYPTQEIFWNFAWTDQQGTNHLFPAEIVQQLPIPCQQNVQNEQYSGVAPDGSGYSVTATYDPNSGGVDFVIGDVRGNEVYPVAQDTNGNYFSSDSNGNLIDTLGRTPVKTTTSGNQITYSVLGFNGAINTYTVTTETVYYSTAFNQSLQGNHIHDVSGSFTAIQSIKLPDGSSYSFTYDSGTSSGHYGELTSVTLPSGGVIQYSWLTFTDSFENRNRWVGTRVRNGGTTTFQPTVISSCTGSTGCQESIIVTDPASNDTVYNFNLDAATITNATSWNSEVAAYQGSHTSGTELEAISTSYSYNKSYVYGLPSGTETFDVPQSQVVDAYLPAVALTAQTSTTFNSTGALPTCILSWDYFSGSSPSNPPTIQTSYTYMNGTGLPTGVEVMDGAGTGNCNGNEVSKTTYSYDQTPASTISGLPNHANVTGFGNLTTVSQWINTGSSPSFTTTSTFDNAGALLTTTDPNGTTTYGYDSTDTFATNTTPPTPSSGVSLGSSATFDFSSGLLTGTMDPNGQPTYYKSYDVFGRVGEIDYPDGGKSTFTYAPTQSSTHEYQSATTYADTETVFDGYGRVIRTATANGQGGDPWYEQDTCYNSAGEVSFQSYSYEAASITGAEMCSGAGDTFAYNAMRQVTTTTHADGTHVVTSYNGRATKTTDENSVGRISQTDALGRTIAVCEISSVSLPPSGPAPASCGLDISGTGYLTTYAYNLQGHQTTMSQGTQTRIFQSDSIGRPILTQEPESGQTTYAYNYNSTGLYVTRTKPLENQFNSSTTTTTTTQYDVLGRPLSLSYTDGVTPFKYYDYDVSPQWGVTLGNPKGRIVADGTVGTGDIYSYDAMGRVKLLEECTPSTCGSNDFQLSYQYDELGNVLSASDGSWAGFYTAYTYSPANEVLTVTSSLSGPTHPGNLVSNAVNGPYGALNWQLGNGDCEARQYDTMGRITGGGVYSGSTPPTCSSGTPVYDFTSSWTGSYLTSATDSVLGPGYSYAYAYDPLGRMASTTVNSGNPGSYTYSFDRWGNRVAQAEVTGSGGPQPNYSFSNNQITSTGFGYDAAGNMRSDGSNTYTYDADGNVTAVSGYTNASYVYDALNHRVRINPSSGDPNEFIFNASGQRSLTFDPVNESASGKAYWDTSPIEFYYSDGQTHWEYQDWQGTERMRTYWDGSVENKFTSLPWGDGYSATGTDYDPYHFASLDQDSSSLDHAQFREYSNMSGRWTSPDLYGGSYDLTNPQSLNRYAYVLNQPLALTDPSGQQAEGGGAAAGCLVGGPIGCLVGGLGEMLLDYEILNWLFPHHPLTLHPTPDGTGGPNWDGNFGESLGISTKLPRPSWGIANVLGLPDAGCDFGVCGTGATGMMGLEDHHIFPQQFAQWFEEHGIDIEAYLIPLSRALHRLKPDGIHTKLGGNWNKVWQEWIEEHPNATPQAIINQAEKMLVQFGIATTDVFSDFLIIINPCLMDRTLRQSLPVCGGGGGA